MILTVLIAFLVTSSSINATTEVLSETYIRELLEKSSQIKTIEDLLEKIPSHLLDENFYAYKSRSLQEASPMFPRAIVHNNEAKFIMAFNGHEEQRGFHELEIIEFIESTNQFDFKTLVFDPKKQNAPEFIRDDSCVVCHHGRPNWDLYFFWPGFYGSEDDYVNSKEFDSSSGMVVEFAKNSKEYQSYLKFKDKLKEDRSNGVGRYRFLPDTVESYESQSVRPEYYERPLLVFNDAITQLNTQRIVDEILKVPYIQDFYFALMALSYCNGDVQSTWFPEILPNKVRAQFNIDFKKIEKETWELAVRSKVARLTRFKNFWREDPPGRASEYKDFDNLPIANRSIDSSFVTMVRVLFEDILSVDIRFWSMVFSPREYGLNTGFEVDYEALVKERFQPNMIQEKIWNGPSTEDQTKCRRYIDSQRLYLEQNWDESKWNEFLVRRANTLLNKITL